MLTHQRYWFLTGIPPRQVRIDGRLLKLSRKEAETDWKVRRRVNHAASDTAPQSSIIQRREDLMEKIDQINRQYHGKPIPCPDTWGGYCLVPDKIEFWEGRLGLIHFRERYMLTNGTWQRMLLAP